MWEGADYNMKNALGETPLYIAAKLGFSDCVLTLLKNAVSTPILSIPTNTNGELTEIVKVIFVSFVACMWT
jgi:ankyrin repeat protein